VNTEGKNPYELNTNTNTAENKQPDPMAQMGANLFFGSQNNANQPPQQPQQTNPL
jgi:hypothetical protein